jgi:chromosome segregation ATPase
VGKRSQDAAAAMQQLAADIADSGPKAQSILHKLNETNRQLQTCKDSTSQLTTEITSLKEKANSHTEQLQQKQDAAKKTAEAEAELQKVQEQLKQKQEQINELQAELKQQEVITKPGEQQVQATAPVSADAVAARLHALETAGLQCNVINDQEVSNAMQLNSCFYFGWLPVSCGE